MESVSALVYCDGDHMISSYEGIVFEYPSDLKVITINEDMLFHALWKIIFDANRSYKILLDLFYHQSIYIVDGCVEYNCVEL